ncbi:dihydroorotate dehydrogenase [Candidatus Bathyarchaeota archaeon]|nr:dihydroorotate dehydrogenase [Candidatus Bathyarchaeota archaeon]
MVGVNSTIEIAGLKLRNPVMLAAGVLGVTGFSLKRVAEAGAGAIVTKSIGIKPRDGYPNPTITETNCGLLNAMGLPNPGVEDFECELKIAKEGGVSVIASIFGASKEEFAYVGSVMEEAGADAIELNVSCPHTEVVALGQSPDLTSDVVETVKKGVDIPVFVKLTPNVTDIVLVAKSAERAGADAITCINTLRAMAVDVETGKPILANKVGGLSGPAIKPVAVRCVFEISKEVNIPVIGCGGITYWQDAVEFLLAGASAIQIGTAIAFRGLSVFKEITDGIQEYLSKKGYRNLKEIVGLSHKF